MRRLIFLSILLIAPASEVFAVGFPYCSEILDWHESENAILRTRNRDVVESFMKGFVWGYAYGGNAYGGTSNDIRRVPDDLWNLPASAYYRLVIKKCEENPAENLSDVSRTILYEYQMKFPPNQ